MQASSFKKLISTTLVFFTFFTSIQNVFAQTQMIPTMNALESISQEDNRNKVLSFIQREDIQGQMVSFGVQPSEAIARVNALTDSEVQYLVEHIENAPAGASTVGTIIGAGLFIFIILLLTDILGLTRVFPFSRSVR